MIERYGHGPDVCTRFQLSLGPPVEYEISRGGHGYEIKNVNMRACTRVGTLFHFIETGTRHGTRGVPPRNMKYKECAATVRVDLAAYALLRGCRVSALLAARPLTPLQTARCELRCTRGGTMLGLLLVGSVAFSSRATSLRVRAPQPRAALVTAILTAAADDAIAPRLWLVKVRAALGIGLGLGLGPGPIGPQPCPWRGAGLSGRTQGSGPGIAFAS